MTLPMMTELIMGFAYRATNAGNHAIVHLYQSTASNNGICLGVSGGKFTFSIPSGTGTGTALGTSTTSFSANTWYNIELRVKLGSGSSGEVELRINGATEISTVACNTATGSITAYKYALFSGSFSGFITNYFDDFYLCDKSGTENNTFMGPCAVYTLLPTVNGTTNNYTAVGATPQYVCVSSEPYDTAKYVESANVGDLDYYAFEALPITPTSIPAVMASAISSSSYSTTKGTKLRIKYVTELVSSTIRTNLSAWSRQFFAAGKAPDGSAWTKAKVDSIEVALETAN